MMEEDERRYKELLRKALSETLLRCDAIAQMPEIREYTIVKEMRSLIKGTLLRSGEELR